MLMDRINRHPWLKQREEGGKRGRALQAVATVSKAEETRNWTVCSGKSRSRLLPAECNREDSRCQELVTGRRRQEPSHRGLRPVLNISFSPPRALPTLFHSAPRPG